MIMRARSSNVWRWPTRVSNLPGSEDDKKTSVLSWQRQLDTGRRVADVMGADFMENAAAIDIERNGSRSPVLPRFPTFHAATSRGQYLFVNGRPVRDKNCCLRCARAYGDLLPSGRHPIAVLFIEISGAGCRCQCASRQDPKCVFGTR